MLPEGWKQTKLEDIAVIRSGSTPARSQQSRYFADAGTPWVKTMDLNNGVIKRTGEQITEAALRETSCRVFPKSTLLVAMYGGFNQIGRTGLLGVDAATNQAISAIQLDRTVAEPEYVLCWLNAHVEDWKRIAASSRKDPNITRDDVCKFQVLLPPLPEQRRIAEILSAWDRAIDLTTQLIAAKQQRKRGLMQALLTGQWRFAEFVSSNGVQNTSIGLVSKDWQFVPIRSIAHQVSHRNTSKQQLPVLSCTKYKGLVDSLKYFGRQIFSEDTSTYKVVARHQFAYATNHIEEGSIGYQDLYDQALISPMYTVFETHDCVDDRFLYAVLKTDIYRQVFERSTSASVDRRGSLRWNDFSKISVPLPSLRRTAPHRRRARRVRPRDRVNPTQARSAPAAEAGADAAIVDGAGAGVMVHGFVVL